MPKGRGSNERRRNRRLAARKDWHGRPTMSQAQRLELLERRPRRKVARPDRVHGPARAQRPEKSGGWLRRLSRRITGRRGA